jgi:Uma2 family endonuclease
MVAIKSLLGMTDCTSLGITQGHPNGFCDDLQSDSARHSVGSEASVVPKTVLCYPCPMATSPPSSRSVPMLQAPGAESGASYRFPSKNDSLPAPGELSIPGEDGYELEDGQLVYAAPAGPTHAEFHAALVALLVASVKPSHKVYVDMLTNLGTVPKNELAPDISMVAHYEQDEPRPLEEVVVEICSTQPLANAERKLRKFANRGVRKLWCIQLSKQAVWQWDHSIDGLRIVPSDGYLEDELLVRPLSVKVLLKTTLQDNEIARALLAKENPVLEQRLDAVFHQGKDDGRKEGLRVAIHTACEFLAITLDESQQQRLDQADTKDLEDVLAYLKTHKVWPPSTKVSFE